MTFWRRDAATTTLESAMLNTRTRMLAAVLDGSGWSHPYASPFVLYADGGGDGSGDGRADGDGDTDGDQDDGAEGDDDQDDVEGDADADTDKDLGDKGKKALRELRRENRHLKSQLRQGAKDGGDSQKQSAKDGGEDDPDTIRERAREEARAEVWGERVEAAAIAAAAGRLTNPQLAARLLDLSDIGETDKGRPDRAAISELIDELLEDEPYLAAQSAKDNGRRFQGGADGGARKTPKKSAASLGEAVAARLAGKSG
ncbi:hypothetical protein OG384_14935 [Streptomyces sp. NBC_01324]|uniref:hypothetical protein n=1 Tax=Streptomyces sp. NBC_01324 TaxID=2903826 RepID=UPI002E13ADA9|nr:hypothetical protein OG384_14935 [Streptomyces sp. NBC_01324]